MKTRLHTFVGKKSSNKNPRSISKTAYFINTFLIFFFLHICQYLDLLNPCCCLFLEGGGSSQVNLVIWLNNI